MKRTLILAVFAVLAVVPVASASGRDLSGTISSDCGGTYGCDTPGSVTVSYTWTKDFSVAYQINVDVTCDNGFVGHDQAGGSYLNRSMAVFATGVTNCTAVESYTKANTSPVVMASTSFAVTG